MRDNGGQPSSSGLRDVMHRRAGANESEVIPEISLRKFCNGSPSRFLASVSHSLDVIPILLTYRDACDRTEMLRVFDGLNDATCCGLLDG